MDSKRTLQISAQLFLMFGSSILHESPTLDVHALIANEKIIQVTKLMHWSNTRSIRVPNSVKVCFHNSISRHFCSQRVTLQHSQDYTSDIAIEKCVGARIAPIPQWQRVVKDKHKAFTNHNVEWMLHWWIDLTFAGNLNLQYRCGLTMQAHIISRTLLYPT